MKEILKDAVSWIFGIGGYSLAWVQVHVPDAAVKFFIMIASALLGGYLGHAGKLLCVWSIKQFRNTISRLKKQKP